MCEADSAEPSQILLVGTTILSVFILGITVRPIHRSEDPRLRLLSFIIPCQGALDTLATQAYTSQNPKTTSLYVQRTGVLLVVGLVPTCTALCFSEHFLVMIGQKVHIAHLAGQYLRSGPTFCHSFSSCSKANRLSETPVYICGVPFLAGFELCRRWLQAQGKYSEPSSCE